MMNQGRKRPVSLEDLLRLKRAERPPAEFWLQFDRELRAKQLAALVEKRPWWRELSLSGFFAGLRRYHLPLGATAILAVTVVSIRNYQPSSPVVPTAPRASATEVALTAPAAQTAGSVEIAPAVEPAKVASAAVTSVVAHAETPVGSAPAALAIESAPLTSLAQIIPVLGAAAGPDEPATAGASGALLVAGNLTTAQTADATNFSRQLLAPPHGFESRAMPARAKPVEPLAQIKIPSSRRSTLLAAAMPVSVSGPVLNSERSARSLSDERLYDTVTRVSARGAAVAVKF